jgi:hypothetical protein
MSGFNHGSQVRCAVIYLSILYPTSHKPHPIIPKFPNPQSEIKESSSQLLAVSYQQSAVSAQFCVNGKRQMVNGEPFDNFPYHPSGRFAFFVDKYFNDSIS